MENSKEVLAISAVFSYNDSINVAYISNQQHYSGLLMLHYSRVL